MSDVPGGPEGWRAWCAPACVFLVGVGLVMASLLAQRPPAPRPADAPPEAFSAVRAFRHVEAVAAEPHPIGTAANRKVRDHLLAALDALGLETEVQRATAVAPHFGTTGRVENVLGRLPGRDDTGAILLVAHYDSVASGPGAADDGAGVAAVLETLRALQAGPALRNDVRVLFSDGEEAGLLGAEAFVDQHPWMDEVGLVVNLEARGTAGPSVLVETGPGNRALMADFAEVVPRPSASSLTYEIYQRLPNDTDFTEFAERSVPGFNFAFIRRAARYHTELDVPGNLDLASLQHHGDHALALTRRFADLDLSSRRLEGGEDVAYTDLFGRALVGIPVAYVLPLAVLSALVWAVIAGVARARGIVRWGGVALGSGAVVTAAVGSFITAALAWAGLVHLQPATNPSGIAAPHRPETIMVAFALTTLLVAWGVMAWAARTAGPAAAAMGALLAWTVLAVATGVWLPGGSHLATWPALAMLVAMGVVVARQSPGRWRLGTFELGVLTAGAVPGLVLIPPVVAEAYFAAGVVSASLMAVPIAVAATLLTPLLKPMEGPRPVWLPLALAAGALVAFVVGARQVGFSEQQPRPTQAFYVVEPARERARFVTLNDDTDAWTSRFFRDPVPPEEGGGVLQEILPDAPPLLDAPAPVADLPAPTLRVREDVASEGTRHVTFELASRRDANRLSLLVHPDVPVTAARVEGRPVDRLQRPNGWTRLTVYGPARDGVTVQLSTSPGASGEIVLLDETHELLSRDDLGVPARPDHFMASATRLSDAVMVAVRIPLGPLR